MRTADHVTAGHIKVISKSERDGHRRERLVQRSIRRVDCRDPGLESARQENDVVSDLQNATGDHSCIAAIVAMLCRLRPEDVLHREPGVDQVPIACDVHMLEVVQKGWALVPRH